MAVITRLGLGGPSAAYLPFVAKGSPLPFPPVYAITDVAGSYELVTDVAGSLT